MENSKYRVCSYFELGNYGSGVSRASSSPAGLEPHPISHFQELLGASSRSSYMDPPSRLKHHAKSQATGQKTQLFSAVTLLNLIFPASSPSLCLRAKCIFGLCRTTQCSMLPRPPHSAEAMCKWAAPLPQSGDFCSEFLEERPGPRSLYKDRQSRDNRATPPRFNICPPEHQDKRVQDKHRGRVWHSVVT